MFSVNFLDDVDEKLDEAALLEESKRLTGGLSNFGGNEFLVPLRLLLGESGYLSGEGRRRLVRTILRVLSNRLRIQQDLEQHPEIRDTAVWHPLFVTGFPRSGTTYLHHILSQGPEARPLLLWELLQPSPPPDRSSYAEDERIQLANRALGHQSETLSRLHELRSADSEECQWIFEHSFAAWIFCMSTHRPTYRTWLLDNELLEPYQFHRIMMQYYTWRFPGQLILKTPSHLGYLRTIRKIYPDARIVQIHRDPLESFVSFCSFQRHMRSENSTRNNYREVVEDVRARYDTYLDKMMKMREAPDNHATFCDVYYSDLVRDPVKVVRTICEHFGMPFSDLYENRIRERSTRPHGVHEYSVSDFEIDENELSLRFAPYRERFNLPKPQFPSSQRRP